MQDNQARAENYKTKKFVFHLYGENVDFIDSLPLDKKDELINELLRTYKAGYNTSKQEKYVLNFVKKAALIVLLVIIGTPILMKIVNISLIATLNSYGEMQRNFEKLFD